jgi:hypothetical protein
MLALLSSLPLASRNMTATWVTDFGVIVSRNLLI